MTIVAGSLKVAVVGAGTMGQGIAQVCAMTGFETLLYDLDSGIVGRAIEQIERNLSIGIEKGKINNEQKQFALDHIDSSTDIKDVSADIIIEAIIEKLDAKVQLFRDLEEINSEETIIATNTSSIPITSIAAHLSRPGNFIGMHFFNPAHVMKLVEVITGLSTFQDTTRKVVEFSKKLGKETILANDSPGFIVNRVARHFYLESLKILEEKVADHQTIDFLMENSGFKMGPFRLMDLIGIDTNFYVTKSIYDSFYQDAKFRPSRIQQQMVNGGLLGMKTGKGFYEYD